jgi:hypothetical protein
MKMILKKELNTNHPEKKNQGNSSFRLFSGRRIRSIIVEKTTIHLLLHHYYLYHETEQKMVTANFPNMQISNFLNTLIQSD